ncbi:PREDICTED: ankyrin repeat domain-containing protein 50-like, partial [Priapulus caudatus]|uniref:Ankyrin repeat domain-containing protein 50-like n=1 Tax=Priapulus caudatus TaxID=37621 RepID=A0ABM1DU85_PRICU
CSGQLDIMRLLLEAGADPNVAMMNAVREGKKAAVRILLSHGANPNATDSHGQTSLYDAARSGRLDIMRLLLEAGADPNVAQKMSGETPLVRAAWVGKKAMVRMLLSHGANPNAADSYGDTSLNYAACFGLLDIMRLLLEAGAVPNAADSYGRTSLLIAVRFGELDIMRMLLEAGADPNVAETEERGSFTALHLSCVRLQTEIITHLLKHGADPNLVDRNKRTPLAIIGSEVEVRISRESWRAEQAESVVQAASALLQTCESAGVLLQVNTRDSEGDTPLHSFCRMMLAWKDDVYAREREGCLQIVHALVFNHGAHVDVVNARGETPYKLWCRTSFHGNGELSDVIHRRMRAQYHSLKCHCARVIIRHSVAYENRLPPSLIEFVGAHARPTQRRRH